jgi:hypothetical protein
MGRGGGKVAGGKDESRLTQEKGCGIDNIQ